jgi:hypothetical protein
MESLKQYQRLISSAIKTEGTQSFRTMVIYGALSLSIAYADSKDWERLRKAMACFVLGRNSCVKV